MGGEGSDGDDNGDADKPEEEEDAGNSWDDASEEAPVAVSVGSHGAWCLVG